MSLKFGLGNSKDDIEIQGEIDYDFFDDERTQANSASADSSPNTYPSHNDQSSKKPQTLIGDSILVSLNCNSNSDAPPYFANLKSAATRQDSGGNNGPRNLDSLVKVVTGGQEECADGKGSKHPKKVIETVIPNLEDYVSPDDESGERKTEENSGSLSSSMTDSDDTSSLSEDSFGALSESESITDVTPLHSPYCCDSPVPQMRASESEPPKDMDCSEEKQSKDSVRFSDDPKWCRGESEPVDLNALVAAIQRLEIQQGQRATKQRNCITPPLVRPRKNMSFSNEEVRRIDQENQRLLKKILAQQTRSKPGLASQPRGSHVSSSQVNRHRQQRQAEIENIALLKRIESAKPSRELSRVKLLRDYNRLSPSLSSQSRVQSRPSTASSTSLLALSHRSGRSHSLPTSNESSTSATPSTSQERPKTAQAIAGLHRLQKQRSLH